DAPRRRRLSGGDRDGPPPRTGPPDAPRVRRARFLPALALSLPILCASPAAIRVAAAAPAPMPHVPSAAVASRPADLSRGWDDLERRARAFAHAPATATFLGGGGVAVDRAALFVAAQNALSGARSGASLTLVDPSGDPVAWAGRAPTVFPSSVSSGAVWSA